MVVINSALIRSIVAAAANPVTSGTVWRFPDGVRNWGEGFGVWGCRYRNANAPLGSLSLWGFLFVDDVFDRVVVQERYNRTKSQADTTGKRGRDRQTDRQTETQR